MLNRPLHSMMLVALASTALLLAPARTAAQADALPRVIPYSGFLERGGGPVSGAVDLRFTLYDQPELGAQLWQETLEGVTVAAGRFSVLLGAAPGSALPESVFDPDPVYLEVEVKQAEVDYVHLQQRQRILPLPFSISASRADRNFQVPGNLNVSGALQAGGGVQASDVAASTITAQQSLTATAIVPGSSGGTLAVDGTVQASGLALSSAAPFDATTIRGLMGTGPHGVDQTSCPAGWSGRCSGPLVHEDNGICFMAQDDSSIQCRVVRDPSGYWRANGMNAGASHQCQASCLVWNEP